MNTFKYAAALIATSIYVTQAFERGGVVDTGLELTADGLAVGAAGLNTGAAALSAGAAELNGRANVLNTDAAVIGSISNAFHSDDSSDEKPQWNSVPGVAPQWNRAYNGPQYRQGQPAPYPAPVFRQKRNLQTTANGQEGDVSGLIARLTHGHDDSSSDEKKVVNNQAWNPGMTPTNRGQAAPQWNIVPGTAPQWNNVPGAAPQWNRVPGAARQWNPAPGVSPQWNTGVAPQWNRGNGGQQYRQGQPAPYPAFVPQQNPTPCPSSRATIFKQYPSKRNLRAAEPPSF